MNLRKLIREGIEDALFEIKIKKHNLLIRETVKDVFINKGVVFFGGYAISQ